MGYQCQTGPRTNGEFLSQPCTDDCPCTHLQTTAHDVMVDAVKACSNSQCIDYGNKVKQHTTNSARATRAKRGAGGSAIGRERCSRDGLGYWDDFARKILQTIKAGSRGAEARCRKSPSSAARCNSSINR